MGLYIYIYSIYNLIYKREIGTPHQSTQIHKTNTNSLKKEIKTNTIIGETSIHH